MAGERAAVLIAPSMFPISAFQPCEVAEANQLLVAWGHKMGALNRPKYGDLAHVLMHDGEPIAVCTTSTLIRDGVGGGASRRANAREHHRTESALRLSAGSLPRGASHVA